MKTNAAAAPDTTRPQIQDFEYDNHDGEFETLSFVSISRSELTSSTLPPNRSRTQAKRAFTAMMEMGKVDVAAIKAARRGEAKSGAGTEPATKRKESKK